MTFAVCCDIIKAYDIYGKEYILFMKVLMINGSPRVNGNTAVALAELEKVFGKNGIETEIVQVGNKEIRGCAACAFPSAL